MEYLQQFDFKIAYHPGKGNTVADALSRRYEVMTMVHEYRELEVLAQFDISYSGDTPTALIGMMTVMPVLFDEIQNAQKSDPFAQKKSAELVVDLLDDCPTEWSIEEDLLKFRGRVYVPPIIELRKRVMDGVHKSKLSIHPGGTKMYHDLKHSFW